MKLKTALELLGDDACQLEECLPYTEWGGFCDHESETIARRAREEAYEMAAKEARSVMSDFRPDEECKYVTDAIRALPTEPK